MQHQNHTTIIGNTRGRPPHQSFGIKPTDRLLHAVIFGQTGTGKSTLLLNLMRQDAEHRQGFCLIDPHGDLADAVATVAGPNAIYWKAADPTCPYGYNPLTHVSAEFRPLVASGLIDTLKKQWSDAWGARMEHLLRYALLTLLEQPNASMADIMPLFLDTKYRNSVVANLADQQVKKFWIDEYAKLRYQTTIDGVAPIANKLSAFLAHPVVREAVCNPKEPLRFRQIMDEGKILIVNLSKGKLGADVANILGGMIVSNIAHAAFSRQNQSEHERIPFFLYIDEFHSFTTSAFADMTSELRKYGLGLILTTQFSSRLDTATLEGILGNVGSTLSFRVGTTDATLLAKQFGYDTPKPSDLVNLANYELFIKMMVDGVQTKPFSASTTLQ